MKKRYSPKYPKGDCRNNSDRRKHSSGRGGVSNWVIILPKKFRNRQSRKAGLAMARRRVLKEEKAKIIQEKARVEPNMKVIQKARNVLRGSRR